MLKRLQSSVTNFIFETCDHLGSKILLKFRHSCVNNVVQSFIAQRYIVIVLVAYIVYN